MSEPSAASIAVAIVSRDREADLVRLLASLQRQSLQPVSVHVVDSSSTPLDVKIFTGGVKQVRSEANLGGAGGFSLAILEALASGADWVWLMDDDANPVGDDCLQTLLEEAESRDLDVVSPIISAPDEPGKLAFPFRVEGRFTYDPERVRSAGFLPGVAQFFNGALVHRSVFYRLGLPDMKLFIRGDEVEFMLRLKRAGLRFGTVGAAAVAHPPGWEEVHWIVQDRFLALIPETDFKRYYFFRNRGYLARRYRRLPNLLMDLAFYPFAFLVRRNGDWAGLRLWAKAFWDGLCYRFDEIPDEMRRERSHDKR